MVFVKSNAIKAVFVLFFVPVFFLFPVCGRTGDFFRVDEIASDGSILLEDGTHVRLSGLYHGDLETTAGRRELSALLDGRRVRFGAPGYEDRRRRRIVHLWRDDGVWIQRVLVAAGTARVYLTAESGADDETLIGLENEARVAERGGWERLDAWKAATPETLDRRRSGPVIVEGTVIRASEWKGTVYLNFGGDSRRDFTAVIPRDVRKALVKRGHDPLSFQDRRLRVRGWLGWKARPEMTIRHPGQIEEIP